MTLRKAPPVVRCDFPSWFKNQKHWHTLSGSLTYNFHQKWVLCAPLTAFTIYSLPIFLIHKRNWTESILCAFGFSRCKSLFINFIHEFYFVPDFFSRSRFSFYFRVGFKKSINNKIPLWCCHFALCACLSCLSLPHPPLSRARWLFLNTCTRNSSVMDCTK